MNKHIATAAAAAALSAALLTGCSDEQTNAPVCGNQPIYYNEEDGQYHCSHLWGPLIVVGQLDADTQRWAKLNPGKPSAPKTVAPAPKPAAPKPAPVPKPAPAPKPVAPAPKPPAPKFK